METTNSNSLDKESLYIRDDIVYKNFDYSEKEISSNNEHPNQVNFENLGIKHKIIFDTSLINKVRKVANNEVTKQIKISINNNNNITSISAANSNKLSTNNFSNMRYSNIEKNHINTSTEIKNLNLQKQNINIVHEQTVKENFLISKQYLKPNTPGSNITSDNKYLQNHIFNKNNNKNIISENVDNSQIKSNIYSEQSTNFNPYNNRSNNHINENKQNFAVSVPTTNKTSKNNSKNNSKSTSRVDEKAESKRFKLIESEIKKINMNIYNNNNIKDNKKISSGNSPINDQFLFKKEILFNTNNLKPKIHPGNNNSNSISNNQSKNDIIKNNKNQKISENINPSNNKNYIKIENKVNQLPTHSNFIEEQSIDNIHESSAISEHSTFRESNYYRKESEKISNYIKESK